MKKLATAAIFVMAIMMSANFAFGQGTTSDKNPTGGTTVKMILTHPSIDTWTFEITHRWKDNQGNWGPWETIERNADSYGQTELNLWTSIAATEVEYYIEAKKANGARIQTTCGTFVINGSVLYISTWYPCLYDFKD